MFDHLTNPVLIETRAAVARFIEDELRPLERELGLGTEDPWPREVLRNVWRRSSELGLYAALDKMHVRDIHASILWLLGLDNMQLTYNHKGRPERPTINEGQFNPKLVG